MASYVLTAWKKQEQLESDVPRGDVACEVLLPVLNVTSSRSGEPCQGDLTLSISKLKGWCHDLRASEGSMYSPSERSPLILSGVAKSVTSNPPRLRSKSSNVLMYVVSCLETFVRKSSSAAASTVAVVGLDWNGGVSGGVGTGVDVDVDVDARAFL